MYIYTTFIAPHNRGCARNTRWMEHLLTAKLAPGHPYVVVDTAAPHTHPPLAGTPRLPLLVIVGPTQRWSFGLDTLQQLCDDDLPLLSGVTRE